MFLKKATFFTRLDSNIRIVSSPFFLRIELSNLQLQIYISQFCEKKSEGQEINLQLRDKKSEL